MKRLMTIGLVISLLASACGGSDDCGDCQAQWNACVTDVLWNCAEPEFGEDCVAVSITGCEEAFEFCVGRPDY